MMYSIFGGWSLYGVPSYAEEKALYISDEPSNHPL